MSTIIRFNMLSITDKKSGYTLIRAAQAYKILAIQWQPVLAQIIGAALAEYWPSQTWDKEYKLTLQAVLIQLKPERFKDNYGTSYKPHRIKGLFVWIRNQYIQSQPHNKITQLKQYFNNNDSEVIKLEREHLRLIAKTCNRSELPLKLYISLCLRQMRREGYARINYTVLAKTWGYSQRQVMRAAHDLIKLGIIKSHHLEPQQRCKHGAKLSVLS